MDIAKKNSAAFSLVSIGIVKNNRIEIEDDNWGTVESVIEINGKILSPNATKGLETFSHLEVVFYMNQVDDSKLVTDARHPRNNKKWPKVGPCSAWKE